MQIHLVPCTPTLAMGPPGATILQISKVAGTPTASIAVSTPTPPVTPSPWLRGLAVTLLMDLGGAKWRADLQAILVQIDHDDTGGRIELRGQQRASPTGPAPTIATVKPGAPSVQHPAFETGGQDIAQHHQSILVTPAGWDRGWYRHGGCEQFGLGAVDLVAEDPSPGRAMGVHSAPAIIALAARRNAGNQHLVTGMEDGQPRQCSPSRQPPHGPGCGPGAQLGTRP